MKELVDEENALIEKKGAVPAEPVLRQAKLDGFPTDTSVRYSAFPRRMYAPPARSTVSARLGRVST